MKKYFFLLTMLVFKPALALSCIDETWSCALFNNQSKSNCDISCHNKTAETFNINSAAQSQSALQFDRGMNDGLGAPATDAFSCELRCEAQTSCHFDFYNPFWGPSIRFNALSTTHINITVNDKWSGAQRFYNFNC